MRFKILFVLLFLSFAAKAQIQEDQLIRDLIESIAENLPEDYDLSELQDRLTYYRKHPINLNNTNAEELKTLVFLSPLQVSNYFKYIQKNGKLLDIAELQSISDFDIQTVERLIPFVTLDESSTQNKITVQNLLKLSDNDLIIRYGRVIESSKGYTNLPGSRYLGTPDRYLMRYRYTYANRVSASLVFEKDAGEYLFNGPKQYPFDFLSGHIALFNTGKFKKIVLGDYSLQFGQALTLWSGFAFGKSPDVASVAKNDIGLRPYTSANEFAFLRGAATTISVQKNFDFTPFISHRKLDASISFLPNGEPVISSINETGLHRSQNEINNKNSTEQLVYGGVLQYHQNMLNIGVIAYHTSLNKAFVTGTGLYKAYNFTGKDLSNIGINYNYTYKNFYLFGEFGQSFGTGIAYVNGVLMSLSQTVSAVILYRNYQKNYHNFFNQATAESSEAINEKGFYTGLNINPNRKWSIQLYGDYFKFPWLKFRVDAPSDGYELLTQLSYTPNKTFKTTLRFKSEIKQQNTDLTVPFNYLDPVKRENYRLDIKWPLAKFSMQNRIEIVQFQKGNSKAEFGYLAYQDLGYSPRSSRLSGSFRLAYFNTASYDSRIYAYEDDVLYNFSFGLYNGKGVRGYLNLKYKLAKKLDTWLRYAVFNYDNVQTVGSGLDEIKGSMKSEMRVQMRYQF